MLKTRLLEGCVLQIPVVLSRENALVVEWRKVEDVQVKNPLNRDFSQVSCKLVPRLFVGEILQDCNLNGQDGWFISSSGL